MGKLQKEVDRLEDELVHEKEKFKAISDELDQTFAEMSDTKLFSLSLHAFRSLPSYSSYAIYIFSYACLRRRQARLHLYTSYTTPPTPSHLF